MAANKSGTQINFASKKIEEEDLLDLWKYFQDRADMLKERQWTVVTWMLTLLSGLIAFSLDQNTLVITQTGIDISKPFPALVLGILGVLICVYGCIVVSNYGTHIQRNWERADRVKDKISDLAFYWKGSTSGKETDDKISRIAKAKNFLQGLVKKLTANSLPAESIYLLGIIAVFLIAYILMSERAWSILF